ncbi:unnamed protein product [Rotaria magnacalcarata]|uniref:Uncharacterized protein n=1 Tax=Rotaria magnacalcarata TaxID=392030 RepID=A0A816C359_9BILA|nr:unnamed protein product [Rotaria magnacalcarata]
MASEKVTIEQAVQKLSEASNNSNGRLNALETKLDEIHLNLIEQHKNMNMDVPNEMMNVQEKMINQIETIQKRTEELQATTTSKLEEKQQQWEQLTKNIRDMRTEMKKICEALERTALRKNDQNQLMEENASTPHTQLNSSTINESFGMTNCFSTASHNFFEVRLLSGTANYASQIDVHKLGSNSR